MLFGILHIDPLHVIFATVLGVWLGVLAWRCGSVWPAIACHIAVNAALNVIGVLAMQSEDSEVLLGCVGLMVMTVAAVAFIVSVRFLARMPSPPPTASADRASPTTTLAEGL